MKKDKLKLYFTELLLLIALLIAIVVSNSVSYTNSAILLTIFTIIICLLLKKQESKSLYKNQVTWLMAGFAIVYLLLLFAIGFIKNEFLMQPVQFSLVTLVKFIIPVAICVFTSEVIRSRLISQEGTLRFLNFEKDISKALTFINSVLIDILIYVKLYDLSNYDEFLAAIGFVLFASVSCNLLYNYTSKRYGIIGVTIYRLITILYAYIIPVTPDVHIYLKSFFRMIYPYFIYLILERTFSKTDFVVSYTDRRNNFISITTMVVVMALVTMLISCEFRFCILVIGSKSMTGAINMGDAVIYEQYRKQEIKNGQVIVYDSEGLKMVHRVVDIKNVNGELRYYTKGDANEKVDVGYITKEKIIGVTKARIIWIGYPTIWFRELFS